LNWIDRLFGKKEESPSQITFDELPEWLSAKSKKISTEIGKNASSLFDDIGEAIDEIKESTASLEEAEPEGRFHLKMVKVATSNRDNMVRQVKMLLENITIPHAADVGTIVAFHESAVQTLTVCLENMMKSYQYTKLVFLEESKQVITDVNALGRLLNQLIEPVNNQKKVLDAIENASGLIKIIKNTTADAELKEKTIKEDLEKIALLKNEIEEKQKALALLENSEQWKRYANYRDELVLLENNAGKIESEIKGVISPLNKALGRLKQLSDSGRYALKPQSREDLNLCLSDPINVNPVFFAEFQNIVESGILNLAPEKTNKIIEQLGLIASSLGSLKKNYQALVMDIESKKDEISRLDIVREQADLARIIAYLQEKQTALENELESSKSYIVSLKHGIELKNRELQQSVSVIDSRMRIYNF
jgi:hypothetical protein